MAHDVFISYSTKDKPVADAVCAKLEAEGLRCWIAPRDILPGMDWGGALIEAIESARVMVLVLSASADASPQIQREVERAVNKGLRIVPLRIEDIKPGKNLEYFLGTPHWLDAITPPLEKHLQYLSQTIKVLLGQEHPGEEIKVAPPAPPPAPPQPHHKLEIPKEIASRRVIIGGIGAAVILLIGMILLFQHGGPVPSKMTGTWTTTGYAGPDKVQFALEIARNGTYRYDVVYQESGQLEIRNGQASLITGDGTERPVGPITLGSSPPTIANLVGAAPASLWPLIGKFSRVTPQLPDANPFRLIPSAQMTGAGKSQPAIWEWTPAFGRVVWQLRFAFDQAGRYIFTASATDLGGFTAGEGKWTATSDVLNTRGQGTYSFVGKNSLVMTGTIRGALTTTRNGQTLWERSTGTETATALMSPAAPVSSSGVLSPTPIAPAVAAQTPGASPTVTPSETPAAAPSTLTPPAKARIRPIDRRFLVAHDTPVYAGPDSTSAILANLRRSKRVHVIGITGDWLQVDLGNGIVGFIPDKSLE
jgi:hypothetical protein